MKPITKSRNQREGGYLGRYKSIYDKPWWSDFESIANPHRRNHRKGNWDWKTLREMRGVA